MSRASGMYLGADKTGAGRAIPVTQTGQLDINALIGQMVDRRKTYYYDCLKLAPGAQVSSTPYQFFFNAKGQPDPYNNNAVKTELETNMLTGGMFRPPYDLILFNLGFLIFGNLQDIRTLAQMGWFEFKILEKTQFMGSLLRHPSGMGITGMSTKTSEAFWNNGFPTPDAVWQFGDYKKYIPPLVGFSLTLNFPETYAAFYQTAQAATNLPADIKAQNPSTSNLPTLLTQDQGGNGLQIYAIMNGLSDGPVS